jgi:hypothetical protein
MANGDASDHHAKKDTPRESEAPRELPKKPEASAKSSAHAPTAENPQVTGITSLN